MLYSKIVINLIIIDMNNLIIVKYMKILPIGIYKQIFMYNSKI